EKFVYRKAAYLFVVTQGARANLIGKGVPPSKVSVMPHWIDELAFARDDPDRRASVRRERGWEGRFVVMFAGNMGIVQGLDQVVKAAGELKEVEDVLIVFVGDGADKRRLVDLAAEAGLAGTVQFLNRVPADSMPDLMAAADTLLVHLKYSQLSEYIIPSKTYAYLAAGKPILMAMRGAAADLVSESQAGVVLPPENPAFLGEAILRLRALPESERARLGMNGRRFLEARFSKKDVLSQYEKKLRDHSLSEAPAAKSETHATIDTH
ncbi:MAG: glycosyltransferase family 4 protein, partial [Acidobacteriota bacterium]|nr:glycosyltransferase family 4 protein [Acidobacteriota bacterium]